MGYPAGLHILERAGSVPGAPAVVLVHGSLDRAESFRRVMRRLPELHIVAYDRRGYQGSRQAGALAEPLLCDALGAFEPPMPWLGFRRTRPGDERPRDWSPLAEDPAEEVERFFSRMVSPSAWRRLSEEGRAGRRADGPALVADLRGLRGDPPFEVMDLAVPALFGRGGPGSEPHHRDGVAWLGAHVPGAAVYEIEGAHHGAHLSHPDHFAAFTRAVVDRATA
jgi:pimeloyl-ACP methyl ester carboxylesterase